MLIAKAIHKLFPATEWNDGGASVLYSLTGMLMHEIPTAPSELALQANYLWSHMLNKRSSGDGKEAKEPEVVAAFLYSNEILEFPPSPILPTITHQHPLRIGAPEVKTFDLSWVDNHAEIPEVETKERKQKGKTPTGVSRSATSLDTKAAAAAPVPYTPRGESARVEPSTVWAFMVVPFSPLPALTDTDLAAMREAFDEEANQRKAALRGKGAKTRQSKAPQRKKKSSLKGASSKVGKKDDTTNEEDKKIRIELAKRKRALEKEFKEEQIRRAGQLKELATLGPHVHVINLINGHIVTTTLTHVNEACSNVHIIFTELFY